MNKNKGFATILLIGIILLTSILALGFYTKNRINKVSEELLERQTALNFGANVSSTELSDKIEQFRLNVNASLTNINNQLISTTSTDPGHKHSGWSYNSPYIFTSTSTDRVGIGTSTPAYNLQIVATASSTLGIGNATLTGCIVMGDTDNAGITYLTALNGVLTATTTKPGVCQ